jgi:hypothetical protein
MALKCIQLSSKINIDIRMLLLLVDGARAHFKSKHAFGDTAKLASDLKIAIERVYFASGHGKGPHDGHGAVFKRFVKQQVLKDDTLALHDAKDVVNLCHDKQFTGFTDRNVLRKVHYLEAEEMNNNPVVRVDKFPGALGEVHSVYVEPRSYADLDPLIISVANLACACGSCLDGRMDSCEHRARLGPRRKLSLFTCQDERLAPDAQALWAEEQALRDESLTLLANEISKGSVVAVAAEAFDGAPEVTDAVVLLRADDEPKKAEKGRLMEGSMAALSYQKGEWVVKAKRLSRKECGLAGGDESVTFELASGQAGALTLPVRLVQKAQVCVQAIRSKTLSFSMSQDQFGELSLLE